MRPISHDDVGYAFLQVGQTAEVLTKLSPTAPAAQAADRDATALLQLWQISESEDAVDEILARLDGTVAGVIGAGGASKTVHLLARKIEVAKAFLAAFREELKREKAHAAAPGIDDGGDR